jgi:hypothetical protein
MGQLLRTSAYLFAFLGVVLIPASSHIFSFQDQFAPTIFSWLGGCFGMDVLGFSSDSAALYLLIGFLLAISFLLSLLLIQLEFWKQHESRIQSTINLILVYYLASRLMVYGYDKIVKTQFYLPEPNILFTPFGGLSKDILFWSVMGTSKLYCVITGVFELIPAILLLFKITRTVGLLLTLFVLMNVLAINFGFDISVKLYSLFLLFITLLLLSPNLAPIIKFFKGETTQLKEQESTFQQLEKPFVRSSLKAFAICLMLVEALYFSFSTGNFNDDTVERPPLHGAYEVLEINDVASLYLLKKITKVERVFFHRRGFVIFQFADFEFTDFKVELDEMNEQLIITNYDGKVNTLNYRLYQGDETFLELYTYTVSGRKELWIKAKQLNWQELPAVQDDFHWTIDSYQ